MKVFSRMKMVRWINVGLLSAALMLVAGTARLHANADLPQHLPEPSSPNAAPEPSDGIRPGSPDFDKDEHTETSSTSKDGDGNIIETETYVHGTKKVLTLTRYNWYYPNGAGPGSVTTYQIGQNGDITTTITTYHRGGSEQSQESWVTNSSGIVSSSNSTMFPDGSKNLDHTIWSLRFHLDFADRPSLGPPASGAFRSTLGYDYLNDQKNIPSGFSVAIFGGADVNQGYSSNSLHFSNAFGSSTSYDQGENSPLGSVGGFEFEYRTRPIVFDGCDFFEDCPFNDKYWHYCDDCDEWYFDPDEPPRIYDPKTGYYHEVSFFDDVREFFTVLAKDPPPVQFGLGLDTSYNGTEFKQSFGDFWSRTNQDNFSMMVNGKMYFDVTPQIRPYLLFGAGFSYLNASTLLTFPDGSTNIGTANEFVPAIQGGVGLEYGINKDISIYGQYTHVVEFGSTLNYTAGTTDYSQKLGDISHDQLTFGARWNIGAGK
jgi:opacity protein-like surface antigen